LSFCVVVVVIVLVLVQHGDAVVAVIGVVLKRIC